MSRGSMENYKERYQRILKTINQAMERCPEAITFLQNFEERNAIKLPAAVREWYSMKDAVWILEEYSGWSGIDHAVPFSQFEHPEGIWYETQPKEFLAQGRLVFLVETQGCVLWAVSLEEGTDPPVFMAENTKEPPLVWRVVDEHFSTFVEKWITDSLPLRRRSTPFDDPIDLD